MDYDLWKTGWYEAEPDITYDEYCSHDHNQNRCALIGLIEELYSSEDLNLDFLQEQLELLASDYGITFDFSNALNLRRMSNTPITTLSK
jgi:hypothetical protein